MIDTFETPTDIRFEVQRIIIGYWLSVVLEAHQMDGLFCFFDSSNFFCLSHYITCLIILSSIEGSYLTCN